MRPIFFASLGFLVLNCVSFSTAFAAEEKSDTKTIIVCRNLSKIIKPKGITPDGCYDQARDYLKEKGIKIMTGSYQAYFALSGEDKSQDVCRNFLKDVVISTQKVELEEAKMLFEGDRAQSLDQAYYSYQSCMDREKEMKAKKSEKKNQKSIN